MTYTRTDTPDFSTRLSREELRVFTAVQGETALAAIVTKTRLEPGVVEDAIAKLVARRLIRPAVNEIAQPQAALSAPPQTVAVWLERRRDAEAFLLDRLGNEKAEAYIERLRECGSEEAFDETVRALAKRLSLLVDASLGEKLLALLDR